MVIKSLAKLDKKTLRERIYEEVVRLIVSGELPSGGWVDEKLVIKRLRVSRTPFREAIGTLAKGGLIEIKPYRGFYVRSFSRNETADLYELYKQLQCFAVELAVPHMSDREFYETISQQSGNAALIDALARCALQIQLCGTLTSVSREFAERTAHGYDDIIQAFKARDTPRAAFLVRALVSHAQEAVLSGFPKEAIDQ